jgi:hypothetical protein
MRTLLTAEQMCLSLSTLKKANKKNGGELQAFYYFTRGKSKRDRDVRWLLGKECQVSRIRIERTIFIIY